ncbi:MAG: VanW family protein [Clostridia bacterium]|nr:VanW family protein [Clostridia bacterium]
MKRFVSLFLILTLWLGAAAGLAEEDGLDPEAETAGIGAEEAVSAREDQETRALDEVDESQYIVTGKVYEEKTLADFNRNSPALYRGMQRDGYGGLYSQKEATRENSISYASGNVYEDILYVGLQWMIVRRDDGNIGYVKREYMAKSTIEAVDPVNTPPFNAQKHTWIATTAKACHVRKTMDKTATEEDDGNNWVILKPGTRISIWQFYDGWAMVNYMRSYGYIDPEELKDLIPVAPTDTELYPDSPIAAYTSYYKMNQTESNLSRIHNIKRGCELISGTLAPGETFNANKIMGPYNRSKGYQPAPVMIEGKTVPGYGGGTCQVSSTLYNVLIQLPGIHISYRRPHGGNGASYLPIHCDAAVGNDSLNLIFDNGYDFPIRIEGYSNDDGALLMLIYRDH